MSILIVLRYILTINTYLLPTLFTQLIPNTAAIHIISKLHMYAYPVPVCMYLYVCMN